MLGLGGRENGFYVSDNVVHKFEAGIKYTQCVLARHVVHNMEAGTKLRTVRSVKKITTPTRTCLTRPQTPNCHATTVVCWQSVVFLCDS